MTQELEDKWANGQRGFTPEDFFTNKCYCPDEEWSNTNPCTRCGGDASERVPVQIKRSKRKAETNKSRD